MHAVIYVTAAGEKKVCKYINLTAYNNIYQIL